MPLSDTQKGAIGQFAFFATAIGTGAGQLEAYTPVADNEGRDAQIRRHIMSLPGISVQIKVVVTLTRHHGSRYLHIGFQIAQDRLKADPRLWYFFGFYDSKELRFHDPAFLVPSASLLKNARIGRPTNGKSWFLMHASVEPDSHDKWSRYRLAPKDLGPRLLEIVDDAGLTASRAVTQLPADGVWLARSTAGGVNRVAKARADAKYDRVRSAVLNKESLSGWYKGHRRVFSPFLLGTKRGEPHVLGYQFDGTSEEPLEPAGSPQNWRCLRLAELTRLTVLPGIWHEPHRGKGYQNCIDQVDVSAYRGLTGERRLRRAA